MTTLPGVVESDAIDDCSTDELIAQIVDPERTANLYQLYARLRDIAPVHRSAFGMWFLTRYEDCDEALRSPDLHMAVADIMAKSHERYSESRYLQSVEHQIIFSNPPDHTRLRRLVSQAFTPRVMQQLRPHISDLVDTALDRIADEGRADVVEVLARFLPCRVICEMLGVPTEDQAMILDWTDEISRTVRPNIDDEALDRIDRTLEDWHAYLAELIDVRAKAPRDDLISALVAAEADGGKLSRDELVSTCVTLLGAGTETTISLIGTGTLALLQNPDQLAELRADPQLIGAAVQELLRFEAPVQMGFPRVAIRDTEVGGHSFARGELIYPSIGAANYDPVAFPDPFELRLRRPVQRNHLSFGVGLHFCIGAMLARTETAIALKALLVDRFRDVRLVDQNQSWREPFTLRGVTSLWVEVD